MVKNLRYAVVALLAMMSFNSALAQDVIWAEDWSDWTTYEKAVLDDINDNYTFTGTVTNDDGSFKSGTTIQNGNLAGGVVPELLIAKNGGTFTANVDLEGKTGDMTLTFKTNRNDMKVEVAGESVALSDKMREGNDDTYTLNVPAGTASIQITFKMETNYNGRLDNIKLFQGQGKKPAGLSWGTSTRTVTINADDNVFPELSNTHELPINYSSSETTVATIDANGTITLIAAGKTVIAAEFVGNDEYEAAKVEYTLTVKDASVTPPETETITVAKALEIINNLTDSNPTEQTYEVKGFVVTDPDFQRKTSDGSLYGNVNFNMADEAEGTAVLIVYRAKGYDNKNFTEDDLNLFKKGDQVIFTGKLQKYGSGENIKPELVNGYLVKVISDDTRPATSIEFAEGYQTRIGQGPDGMFPEIGESIALPTATVKANEAAVSGATINWSVEVKSWKAKEGEAQPTISDGKVVFGDGYGQLTVKAEFAGNEAYQPSNKSYTLTVHNCYGLLKELAEDIADPYCEKNDENDKDGKPTFYFFRNIDAEGFPVVTNTVTFANEKYIYLTDGQANLLFYGDNTQNLKQGDVISGNVSDTQLGGFWGDLKRFNKLPEFSFTEMNVKVESEGQAVEPKAIAADKLVENINAYVKVENAVFVNADNKNFNFTVGDASLLAYNQFNINAALETGATYTVVGMGAVRKTSTMNAPVYQVYPINFIKTADPAGIDTVRIDAQFGGKRYNMAGQVVNEGYKGLVIVNGKKIVQK